MDGSEKTKDSQWGFPMSPVSHAWSTKEGRPESFMNWPHRDSPDHARETLWSARWRRKRGRSALSSWFMEVKISWASLSFFLAGSSLRTRIHSSMFSLMSKPFQALFSSLLTPSASLQQETANSESPWLLQISIQQSFWVSPPYIPSCLCDVYVKRSPSALLVCYCIIVTLACPSCLSCPPPLTYLV